MVKAHHKTKVHFSAPTSAHPMEVSTWDNILRYSAGHTAFVAWQTTLPCLILNCSGSKKRSCLLYSEITKLFTTPQVTVLLFNNSKAILKYSFNSIAFMLSTISYFNYFILLKVTFDVRPIKSIKHKSIIILTCDFVVLSINLNATYILIENPINSICHHLYMLI